MQNKILIMARVKSWGNVSEIITVIGDESKGRSVIVYLGKRN